MIRFPAILAVLALLLVLPARPASAEVPGLSRSALLEAINAERAKAGLTALTADPGLDAAAQEWAQTAARRRSLSHRKDLKPLMLRGGWSTLNENIYTGTGAMSPARIVRAWMASPGHRKNLLAPRITAAGLGAATAADGAAYAVFNGAGR